MRVLILGSKGMLGQELARVFSRGHEVFAWDRAEIDVTDVASAREKIFAARPEVIINSVAYNAVDLAEAPEGERRAFAVNRDAVKTLAVISSELDIPLAHFSTDYVFDGVKKEGYIESDEPNPQSVYAKSKYEGEVALRTHAKKWYLIRLSKLFGKPATSEGAKKSFVDTMLDLVKSKNELNLVNEELSSPTYAPDLAEAVKEIVESKKPFGIYHRANSGACTWYEFGKMIFELADLRIKVNPVPASAYPRPAPRPAYSVLLSAKLPALRPWEDALAEYLRIMNHDS